MTSDPNSTRSIAKQFAEENRTDHFDGFGTGFFFIQFLMNDKRLHDLAPYGENTVEPGHGLLENH